MISATSMRQHLAILSLGALILAGCASAGPGSRGAAAPARGTATRPAPAATLPSEALLTLDQITPVPRLASAATSRPTTSPATTSSSLPPLDAIELYAHARDALIQNQRFTAINLLEKAVALDPDSFQLNYELGRAYLGSGGSPERAMASLRRAEQLNPNSLSLQTDLGRALQSRGDSAGAIEHFRLAMQTDEYKNGDPLDGVVDYRLAVALQQRGYDRAALDLYDSLRYRLEHEDYSSRATPELAYLIKRPDLLYEEIGRISDRLGDFDRALQAYGAVAENSPTDFDKQTRFVKALVKDRQDDSAIEIATSLVRRFHASNSSIKLLKETYQELGRGNQASADALRKLLRDQPRDRAILFALADTLAADGKTDDAVNLLQSHIDDSADVEIVQRVFTIYEQRNQTSEAAKVLIAASARKPDMTTELAPLMSDLLPFTRPRPLRLATLQKLDVPPEQQAAKDYWIWLIASNSARTGTARAALEQAISGPEATQPFDPAYRALIDTYASRSDWDEKSRRDASQTVIAAARKAGREDLACELEGIVDLGASDARGAAQKFSQAISIIQSGGDQPGKPRDASPDLQLELATAHRSLGELPRFEQIMWKLLSDRPHFEPAYVLLLNYYQSNNVDSGVSKVLDTWLTADPNSSAAQVQQAFRLFGQGRNEESLALLKRLYDQYPEDAQITQALLGVCTSAREKKQVIDLLEAEQQNHPANRTAVMALVAEYKQDGQFPRAREVLDEARSAAKSDPDLLYSIAHLYELIGLDSMTEQVLGDVLRIDPHHAAAGNDLGYTWADQGKNLDRAESLVRGALEVEPDNPSYLDSLGWVLYKRGRFDEARKLLEQAAQPLETADPVVLDHLGDTLYRLDRSAEAETRWVQSLDRLTLRRTGDDFDKLRASLQGKLRSAREGKHEDVDVAPVVESPPIKGRAQK